MSGPYDDLCAEAARTGLRAHARWDAALFDELAQGPGRALWQAQADQPGTAKVARAWLRLLAEAVGLGYLDRPASAYLTGRAAELPESANLLGRCLLQLLPKALPGRTAKEQLTLLSQAWNLGEGLLDEPAWLNRYVAAASAELADPTQLEAFLVKTLEPALTPARAARFSGPFTVQVMDLRPLDDAFLPGEMHFAAPAVLCVHDRRRPALAGAVFLAPQGQGRLLGQGPCLAPGGGHEGPPVTLAGGKLQVGGAEAPLPLLGRPHLACTGRSGFVVASAVDSQRLWVADTP